MRRCTARAEVPLAIVTVNDIISSWAVAVCGAEGGHWSGTVVRV